MNSDKPKTYTRIATTALITILLLIAVILLIKLIVGEVKPYLTHHNDRTNTLISDEKIEKLKSKGLRQQIISYQSPYLIDTLNQVYLIPVAVKTLDKSEKTNNELISIKKERVAYEIYNESNFEGLFSNLIVYDYKNNITKKVCSNRMIGMNLKIKQFADDIMLVFAGSDTDSNKDGIIDYRDFRSLFIYSKKADKLQKFGIENSSTSAFDFVEKEKDILVTWKYDRNGDKEFDQDTEPSFITKYDDVLKSMTPVVDSNLEKEIQKVIDKN